MNTVFKIFTFLFSLAALCLSIYAVSNNCSPNITSTVLGLVGVCATLIVGASVIDVVAVHTALHNIQEKMEEQSQKMDEKIEDQEKKVQELSKLKEKVNTTRRQTNILFHYTWGLTLSANQPYAALTEYWHAFQLATEDEDFLRAKSCLENINSVIEDIIRRKKSGDKLDNSNIDTIPIDVPDNIMDSKVYSVFKERVDELITNIRTIKKYETI